MVGAVAAVWLAALCGPQPATARVASRPQVTVGSQARRAGKAGERMPDRIRRAAARPGQHPPAGPGTPGPAAGWSTRPVAPVRSTAPKWTTYHRPRQEISDAMPIERTWPCSR